MNANQVAALMRKAAKKAVVLIVNIMADNVVLQTKNLSVSFDEMLRIERLNIVAYPLRISQEQLLYENEKDDSLRYVADIGIIGVWEGRGIFNLDTKRVQVKITANGKTLNMWGISVDKAIAELVGKRNTELKEWAEWEAANPDITGKLS